MKRQSQLSTSNNEKVRRKLIDFINIGIVPVRNYGIVINLQHREKAESLHYSGELEYSPHRRKIGDFTVSQAKLYHEEDADECNPEKICHKLLCKKRKCSIVSPISKKKVLEEKKQVKQCQIDNKSNEANQLKEALKSIRAYALRLKKLWRGCELETVSSSIELPALKDSQHPKTEPKSKQNLALELTQKNCDTDCNHVVAEEHIHLVYCRDVHDRCLLSVNSINSPSMYLSWRKLIKIAEQDDDTSEYHSGEQLTASRVSSYYTKISEGTFTDDESTYEEKTAVSNINESKNSL